MFFIWIILDFLTIIHSKSRTNCLLKSNETNKYQFVINNVCEHDYGKKCKNKHKDSQMYLECMLNSQNDCFNYLIS